MEQVAEFEDRTQSAGTGKLGNTRARVKPLQGKVVSMEIRVKKWVPEILLRS